MTPIDPTLRVPWYRDGVSMSACELCGHESGSPYDFAVVELAARFHAGPFEPDRTLAAVSLCRRCLARFEARGRRRHEARLWWWVERAVRDAVRAERVTADE